MVFVNLRLRGPRPDPRHDDLDARGRVPFFRLTETPLAMPWLAPRGQDLITADIGAEIGDEWWEMDDAELGERCIDALSEIVPTARRDYLGCRVVRQKLAYPVFHVDHEADRRRLETTHRRRPAPQRSAATASSRTSSWRTSTGGRCARSAASATELKSRGRPRRLSRPPPPTGWSATSGAGSGTRPWCSKKNGSGSTGRRRGADERRARRRSAALGLDRLRSLRVHEPDVVVTGAADEVLRRCRAVASRRRDAE